MEPKLVNSIALLKNLLGYLGDSEGQPPRLYMDLEGNNLSRNGTLSLVTVLLEPEEEVHLIDVTTLGRDAFSTTDATGRTLRSVLESSTIIKVFFDIRNDSDALFGLYGIQVAEIEDLQLMELASRSFAKRNVNGLARCIERDSTLHALEKQRWQAIKDKGKTLFDPHRGGSYAVFDERPLSEDIKRYCTQDVTFMPHLRDIYRSRLCNAWWSKIEAETKARIRLSQSPSFRGKGQHMAMGPPGWLSYNPSASERLLRSFTKEAPSRERILKVSPALLGHISAPGESVEVDELADMVRKVALRRSSWDLDDEFRNFDVTPEGHGGFHSGNSDESRDYTACDKECGYCGHCDY
ncbi:hypothetical protein HII31_00062 [Pseudocercospora fuligena]|uniref:3'-5' exonuclease domain-containing protein n=1 Tax=Pseudocercospora fuligena TaxID=685502 RepID=A0A8H6RWV4_9PEZI|nr:hypothetical protein HII31_00062 [Pseudocercospora fuligena]